MSRELCFLLTSVGRRTSLVRAFTNELAPYGRLLISDMSAYAAAMHTGGEKVVLPEYRSSEYLDSLLSVCDEYGVQGLTSLTDYELTYLSAFKDKLSEHGVTFFGSDVEISQKCLDKWLLSKELEMLGFPFVQTFIDIGDFEAAIDRGLVEFPVFIKPRFGSGSLNTFVAGNMQEVKFYYSKYPDMMIQEYICGEEFGVDVYRDILSQEVISIFIKKKYSMRSGETDKAVSVKNPQLFEIIESFVKRFGLMCVMDMDVLFSNGQYYIFDVNPRFGGGYPLAYECGCNFPLYIINNLQGNKNERAVGNYPADICMFKCDYAVFKSLDQL